MLSQVEKYTTSMELKVITLPNLFENEAQIINQLFEQGMACLHVRKPSADPLKIELLIRSILPCYYKKIIIHDFFDLAEKYDLAGIHFTHHTKQLIGNDFAKFKKSCGCHSFKELKAVEDKVDIAFLSPVYNSISKKDYPSKFKLSEIKKELCHLNNLQVFALGGITPDKIEELKDAGFYGIAALGSIWQSDEPVEQLMKFQNKLK